MDKESAIKYCYEHRNEFIRDAFACREDGVRQFDCLIGLLESDYIKPSELSDYGMDY